MLGWSDILSFFGWDSAPQGEKHQIEDLLDEIEKLIVQNEVGSVEIDREIDRIKVFEQERVDQVKEGIDNEHLKRIALREVRSLRKRLGSLDRVGRVFQQNIDIHLAVQLRLQDQLATGMKSITHAQLEDIVLDHGEMLSEHRDVMASAAELINPQSYIDNLKDDPELEALAAEIEAEFKREEALLE